jgi:DNA repair exonuclease SbcCD ATPase subunit
MRFVTFKSLKGKNFLSFGDNEVHIDLYSGVNTIIGTNLDKEDSKNGAGKSTITELLYFCLFGTTLREIQKDNIQNSITNKKLETSLTFDVTCNGITDSYTICRKLNPTKCQLFKNEEEITRSTLAKTNELIQSIIRTSSTIFQNSVIMVANATQPFMALSKVDKRKFIESILGLEVFSSMVLRARDEYNQRKKEYEIEYSLLEQVQSELTFNNTQLINYETLKEERIDKLNEKKQRLKIEINEATQQLQTLPVDLEATEKKLTETNKDINELQEKRNIFNTKHIKAESELKSLIKQIDKINQNKDQCPTCNREYSEEHVSHANDTILKLNTNIKLYEQAISKITKELISIKQTIKTTEQNKLHIQDSIDKIYKNKAANDVIKTKIDHLKMNYDELTKEIKIITDEQNGPLKVKIEELTKTIQDKNQNTSKLNNELNVLESVKFVLSEEGIKSFIVKKILTILNSRLAFYLKKLEANCLCKFNEFFEEEIIDENNTNKSYFNFSGGERKRIDIACLFAFADIRRLQGDVNFSTIFYDELFDSSLDDRGVSLTLKVLQERFTEHNESCYIITHRGVHGTFKANHTIHVVKQHGISNISKDVSDRYLK